MDGVHAYPSSADDTLLLTVFRLTRTLQLPGRVIITRPRGYHKVINLCSTLASAANFATPTWLKEGVKAKVCKVECPFYLYAQSASILFYLL